MRSLRLSLAGNAAFSFTSGAILIAGHNSIAGIFGVQNSTPFWIVGIGLILFSATVWIEARRQRPLSVLSIIGQDILWVAGSIVLIVVDPFQLTTTGNIVIAIIAIVVLLFADLQALALAKMDTVKHRLKRLQFERTIKAPRGATWKLVSDVANYHKVAPNIDSVKIISGEEEGMVRQCRYGKDGWTETCTYWQEDEKYSFEVDTSAPDYPYPLSYLSGTWKVEELSPGETRIIMIFDFRYKYWIQDLLIHPFMKGRFQKICDELLDNWQKELE